MLKRLVIILTIFILLVGIETFAEEDVNVGDFIEFGNYSEFPIIWRVIGIDDAGNPLLYSYKAITEKGFDASGVAHDEIDNIDNGSNNWRNSNIRQWLNSETDIINWNKNTPTIENFQDTRSDSFDEGYSEEEGFLSSSNFSYEEKSMIFEVENKTVATRFDLNNIDGGSELFKDDDSQMNGYHYNDPEAYGLQLERYREENTNFDKAYYQLTKDRVFLLSTREITKYLYDNGYDYSDINPAKSLSGNSTDWWIHTRSPLTTHNSYIVAVYYVKGIGGADANHLATIKPALYLDKNLFGCESGVGTESDPYSISYISDANIDITGSTQGSKINFESLIWSRKSIEELWYEEIIKDEAFDFYSEGISRERFVYLMVRFYEVLTNSEIEISSGVLFSDTENSDALKAASIGITSGIGEGKFGPDIVLNREQMATFLIKTLTLLGITIDEIYNTSIFIDDNDISLWAKDSIYLSRRSGIISGIGNNTFDPKGYATNEQALILLHKLFSKYSSLNWYKEVGQDRVCFENDGVLYKLPLSRNILVNVDNDKIQLMSINDIIILSELCVLDLKDISVIEDDNPNIEGEVIITNTGLVSVEEDNIYYGVDTIGTRATISIDGSDFIAFANRYNSDEKVEYTGYDTLKYYDLLGDRKEIVTLSIAKVCESLNKVITIKYHALWNLYIVELEDI